MLSMIRAISLPTTVAGLFLTSMVMVAGTLVWEFRFADAGVSPPRRSLDPVLAAAFVRPWSMGRPRLTASRRDDGSHAVAGSSRWISAVRPPEFRSRWS